MVRGPLRPSLWMRDSQVVPDRKAPITSASATWELVALLGEASNVPAEGFIGLLAAVLEVPWVSRAFVHALEVAHEDLG